MTTPQPKLQIPSSMRGAVLLADPTEQRQMQEQGDWAGRQKRIELAGEILGPMLAAHYTYELDRRAELAFRVEHAKSEVARRKKDGDDWKGEPDIEVPDDSLLSEPMSLPVKPIVALSLEAATQLMIQGGVLSVEKPPT